MKIYLQTRGVAHDYAFLGETPPNYWWAVPFYKDATSFEQPSLILECGKPRAGEWRCFISAIPSKYRDCVNTRIRYSIALSGDGNSDTNVLRKLLASVLNIFNKNPVSEDNLLTELLDTTVEENADKWLGVNSEQKKIRDRINGLTEGFNKLESCHDSGERSKSYEKLCDFLDNNSPCRAVILNFIGKKGDPSEEHLRSQVKASESKILIFPSPVAGGHFEENFVLEPSAGNSPESRGFVVDVNFPRGPQKSNQTTEDHNIMRSSFGTSDVRGSRNSIALMVVVTIIVALLVVTGCYLARNRLEVAPNLAPLGRDKGLRCC